MSDGWLVVVVVVVVVEGSDYVRKRRWYDVRRAGEIGRSPLVEKHRIKQSIGFISTRSKRCKLV